MKKLYILALAAMAATAAANAEAAEKLYIIGDFVEGGWGPLNGIEMTKTADGVFEYEADFSANAGFGFVTQLGENDGDWAGMNSHRYSPVGSSNIVNGDNPMKYNQGDACWNAPAGKYRFTVDTNTDIFKVAADGEIKIEIGDLYLRGVFNDWGYSDEGKFTTTDENIYTLAGQSFTKGDQFKIGNASWGFALSSEKTDMAANGEYKLVEGGQDNNMSFGVDVSDCTLTVNIAEMTLTVSGTSGIAAVEASTDGAAEYFNLQGMRVENPSAGLYIERRAGRSSKVYIR